MGTNRRSFLSQTAFGLLTLGVSQSGLISTAQTLAAKSPQKLALLVGINHYGEENSNLQGCVTDVERQQELLIYRFGFNPSDIVTLTDQQATRDGIETAFSRIERVDATSAFATKPIPNKIVTKSEQKVDCIFNEIVSTPPKTVSDPDTSHFSSNGF